MDQTPATTTEERVEDNIDWYFDVDKANRLKEILEEVFEQEAISKDIARMLFAKSDEFFRLEEVDHQRKVVMPEDWSEEAQRLCRKALVLEELISQRKEQETEVSAKEKHAKLDASAIERKENLGSLKDLRDRIHEYLKKKHHTTIDPTAYKKTWSLGKIKDQKYLGSLDWETDEALYKRLKEMWEEHPMNVSQCVWTLTAEIAKVEHEGDKGKKKKGPEYGTGDHMEAYEEALEVLELLKTDLARVWQDESIETEVSEEACRSLWEQIQKDLAEIEPLEAKKRTQREVIVPKKRIEMDAQREEEEAEHLKRQRFQEDLQVLNEKITNTETRVKNAVRAVYQNKTFGLAVAVISIVAATIVTIRKMEPKKDKIVLATAAEISNEIDREAREMAIVLKNNAELREMEQSLREGLKEDMEIMNWAIIGSICLNKPEDLPDLEGRVNRSDLDMMGGRIALEIEEKLKTQTFSLEERKQLFEIMDLPKAFREKILPAWGIDESVQCSGYELNEEINVLESLQLESLRLEVQHADGETSFIPYGNEYVTENNEREMKFDFPIRLLMENEGENSFESRQAEEEKKRLDCLKKYNSFIKNALDDFKNLYRQEVQLNPKLNEGLLVMHCVNRFLDHKDFESSQDRSIIGKFLFSSTYRCDGNLAGRYDEEGRLELLVGFSKKEESLPFFLETHEHSDVLCVPKENKVGLFPITSMPRRPNGKIPIGEGRSIRVEMYPSQTGILLGDDLIQAEWDCIKEIGQEKLNDLGRSIQGDALDDFSWERLLHRMNTTLREMDFTPSQRRAFARTLCRTIESKAEGDSGASELIGFYNEDGTVKSFWKIKLTELQRIGGLVRSFPDQDMVILHASRGELRGISDFKDGNTVTIYAMTHTRKGEPR